MIEVIVLIIIVVAYRWTLSYRTESDVSRLTPTGIHALSLPATEAQGLGRGRSGRQIGMLMFEVGRQSKDPVH